MLLVTGFDVTYSQGILLKNEIRNGKKYRYSITLEQLKASKGWSPDKSLPVDIGSVSNVVLDFFNKTSDKPREIIEITIGSVFITPFGRLWYFYVTTAPVGAAFSGDNDQLSLIVLFDKKIVCPKLE